MQSAAQPVENAAAMQTENAAAIKNEQTNPSVSQFVQVNSLRTDSPKNMTLKLPETAELSVTPETSEMNGSPEKFGIPVKSENPITGPTGVNSAMRPIDPAILEDIASMQVSTSSTINKGQAVSATTPKAETVPMDMKPEPVIGVTGASPEPGAVPATEIELPKKSLGHTESELFLKAADKTDSTFFAPVAFDSVLKSVEQAPVPSAVAAQPRPDLHEVARQVMDGMSASTDRLKSSQVIITLKPEHLGEVTVKINVDGDRVTAAFHAASSEVRAILESSLPQLRQEMSRQGWSFDSNGVFGGMHEFLSNQQHQQQKAQEQQMLQFANRAQRDEYDDSAAFTNNGRLKVMSATAVDYRI
jgi:flagellar hook-length control protein FliK